MTDFLSGEMTDARKIPPEEPRKNWGALAALLVFALGSALLYGRHEGGEAIEGSSPLIGFPAPSLAAPGVGASPPLNDADLRGHVALVNFFASWCGPCRAEQDVLMDLSRNPRLRGRVVLLGVAFKDRAADVEAFLAGRGDPFARIGADPLGNLAARWGVRGIPHTFVVDASGTVIDDFLGPMGTAARARLDKVLAAPDAAARRQ
jgi:cytochrome c biogenesis protein CcmG, thiol:disulfide interchange protein DsbE